MLTKSRLSWNRRYMPTVITVLFSISGLREQPEHLYLELLRTKQSRLAVAMRLGLEEALDRE